ncbi:unnamed protein product [Rotaria sordida]|uniref:WAP domain-containing protein n=1 Tax=Rotaria sordida TaxID=392033 RepID=A0A818XK59_9BILA|nr:unnamed protein product [Rotaria sordida]CAF3741730.1 unnamed protein product [Rotaria sordida]
MSRIVYIFVVLSIIAIAIANPESVCPGYGFVRPEEPCVDECKSESDTCDTGMKCCYTPLKPCGYRCLVGKDKIDKNGTCPPQDSDQDNFDWYLCDGHSCDVDYDCPCGKKCCPNKCGSKLCFNP